MTKQILKLLAVAVLLPCIPVTLHSELAGDASVIVDPAHTKEFFQNGNCYSYVTDDGVTHSGSVGPEPTPGQGGNYVIMPNDGPGVVVRVNPNGSRYWSK